MTYRFTDPKDTACFVCNHVLNKERPILYVTHESEDGFWQFLCGGNDHLHDDDYKMISLEEVASIDESANDLHKMPMGLGADRESKLSKWKLFSL